MIAQISICRLLHKESAGVCFLWHRYDLIHKPCCYSHLESCAIWQQVEVFIITESWNSVGWKGPLKVILSTIRSPWSLSSPGWATPAISAFLHNPLIIFAVLHWTDCSESMYFLCWRSENCLTSVVSQEQRRRITSLDDWPSFLWCSLGYSWI